MVFQPRFPVKSNQALPLTRGNPFEWVYTPAFAVPNGAIGTITFANSSGVTIAEFASTANNGTIPFSAEPAASDAIPAYTSWVLTVNLNDGVGPRVFEQGIVNRVEAPFPTAPSTMAAAGVAGEASFSFLFSTVGVLNSTDWNILTGTPAVYDNTANSVDAVAAGANASLSSGGSFTPVGMLFQTPLLTDGPSITYTVVPDEPGDLLVIMASKSAATNFAAIHHHSGGGTGDFIAISTGSGPTAIVDRSDQVAHTCALETFTAQFYPSINTYALFLGDSTTPLVTWQDTGNIVQHGAGNRYVGLGFISANQAPGPGVSTWSAADNLTVGPPLPDAAGPGVVGTGTVSYIHPVGVDANAILIGLNTAGDVNPTVTVGGVEAAVLNTVPFGTDAGLGVWGLMNPPTGDITIQVIGSADLMAVNSVSYIGAAGLGSVVDATGTGTVASQSIASTPSDIVFQAISGDVFGAIGEYTQTQRSNQVGTSEVNFPLLIGDMVGSSSSLTGSATLPSSTSWASLMVPIVGTVPAVPAAVPTTS